MQALHNIPAPNAPFFTPAQTPPAGTAIVRHEGGGPLPKLFTPIKIRGVEFQNRIWLSPLCQYSAKDGFPTQWHLTHLGGIISRGPGLAMMEATAVTPTGRITPEDLGIWSDDHIPAFASIVSFAHSQNQKIGIQLAHAGRKASMVAPWLSYNSQAAEECGGWPNRVVAPSALVHADGYCTPNALTVAEIHDIRDAFIAAAERAVKAGFDVVEVHGGHGFLLHQFLSPVANHRTDEYGGSWENRTRFALEVVDGIAAVISEDIPLIVRIPGTDCLENTLPDVASWRIEDAIRYAELLVDHRVDAVAVVAGGVHKLQDLAIKSGPAYFSTFSAAIKAAVGHRITVTTVGGIYSGTVAEDVLEQNKADACYAGRWFQKNPGLVWQFAEELGVQIAQARQIEWGFFGRGVGRLQ